MKISSLAFQDNGMIPSKYSCDGENINPPLQVSDIPIDTKSLVLIMDDPDIPDFVKTSRDIEVFDHWVVFNIEPQKGIGEGDDVFEIKEGVEPVGTKGVNSSGDPGYIGPCPPDGKHRYFFKVYALDSLLELPEGASKLEVEIEMGGKIIASAEVIGLYERV